MALAYAELFKGASKKVLGVAKNYFAAGETPPEVPTIFMKPITSIINSAVPIPLPPGMDVRYECKRYAVEIGVMIGRQGKNIAANKVDKYIGGYFLAIDLTAANLQAEARSAGLPWTISKGYDGALAVSPFIAREVFPDPHNNILFRLFVPLTQINGELKQCGNTADMHFKIPFLITYLSKFFTLKKGDLILTGTPAGTGLLKSKDKLEANCERDESILHDCHFRVA